MAPILVIVVAALLAVGTSWGHARNRRIRTVVLDALAEVLKPHQADYSSIGRGIALGFNFACEAPVPVVRGILTLLPRYAVLYLPIARMLRRGDLLKLTFVDIDLPPGTGSIVREHPAGPRWMAILRDADWVEKEVIEGGHRYRLFSFNPHVERRLLAALSSLAPIEGIYQLTLDSRDSSVIAYIRPSGEKIHNDLRYLLSAVFGLTEGE